MNVHTRIVDWLRRLRTPPSGYLLWIALLWGALGILIGHRAVTAGRILLGIEGAGFFIVAVLLWGRTRFALIANTALGAFMLAIGIEKWISTGKWSGALGGICILLCYFAFRDELRKTSRGGSADGDRDSPHGPGLCIALLRQGWKPHRFPDSDVIVALPHDFVAGFDGEGTLIGTLNGKDHHFSATLHGRDGLFAVPHSAYGFIDHLAAKSNATPIDKGTYRYFKDPETKGDDDLAFTFYVIGIPSAVVVISIASPPGEPRPPALAKIEAAIPELVGELAT